MSPVTSYLVSDIETKIHLEGSCLRRYEKSNLTCKAKTVLKRSEAFMCLDMCFRGVFSRVLVIQSRSLLKLIRTGCFLRVRLPTSTYWREKSAHSLDVSM